MGWLKDVGKRVSGGARQVVGGGGIGNTLRGLGQLADPFGIDPIGKYIFRAGPNRTGGLHDFFADAFDPSALKDENDQNRLFKKVGAAPDWLPPPLTPEAQARMTGFQNALSSLRQRRASQTLFTGGMGVSGTPNVSSSNLLGM